MKKPSLAPAWLIAAALAALSAGGVADAKPPMSGHAASTVADTDPRVTPTVRAVRTARASTVNIHSEKRASNSEALFAASRDRKVNGMGTGIVVDERGYIVTNHHVVLDVDSLRCVLSDGTSHTARVVSFDRRQDLAIIKIEAGRPLETMPLGTSSDLMLGEDVLAIGNAFGYEHTVTRGIVSSLSRDVEVNAEQGYENLIQIDAAINPGNSGGPLINCCGEVIGINVAIRAGAQKIGFAIPIDDARRIIARLMSVEQLEQKFHGAVFEDRKRGPVRQLVVARVNPGSPAFEAGLRPGDVVKSVGGRGAVDAADFERLLLGRRMNDAVPVTVDRGGRAEDLSVRLAALSRNRRTAAYARVDPAPAPRVPARAASVSVRNPPATAPQLTARPKAAVAPVDAWSTFGLSVAPLSDKSRLDGTSFRGGLLVTRVRANGPAAREHVRAGDVLVGLDGFEITTPRNLEYVVRNAVDKSAPMQFYVRRKDETLFGTFSLGDAN